MYWNGAKELVGVSETAGQAKQGGAEAIVDGAKRVVTYPNGALIVTVVLTL